MFYSSYTTGICPHKRFYFLIKGTLYILCIDKRPQNWLVSVTTY